MSLDMLVAFFFGGLAITTLICLTPNFYDYLSNYKKSIIYNSKGDVIEK